MVEYVRPEPARHETTVADDVSFENFLKYFAEEHAEWLVGKVILIVTNNTQHQIIIGFLFNLFSLYLGYTSLGKVLLAGVPMYLGDDQPAREPDLLVILNEHRDRIKENHLEGVADIAVEIVSPESTIRDRGDKFDEYEAAGVPEYWLFDPVRETADIYALGDDSRYHRRSLDQAGRVNSGLLPGFAFDPALLWLAEPPAGQALIDLVQQMVAEKP